MITFPDFRQAIQRSMSILREHETTPRRYLNLDEISKGVLATALSRTIPTTQHPTRAERREELLQAAEVGMMIGLEMARAKVEQ